MTKIEQTEPVDSIMFDSTSPHGMKALNGKTAKFITVLS